MLYNIRNYLHGKIYTRSFAENLKRMVMEQIEINGLLLDKDNLEVDGKKYFLQEEAIEIASKLGKRLPTVDEFLKLLDLGVYDVVDNGVYLGYGLFIPFDDVCANYFGEKFPGVACLLTDCKSVNGDFSGVLFWFEGITKVFQYGTPLSVRLVQDVKH